MVRRPVRRRKAYSDCGRHSRIPYAPAIQTLISRWVAVTQGTDGTFGVCSVKDERLVRRIPVAVIAAAPS